MRAARKNPPADYRMSVADFNYGDGRESKILCF